MTMVPILTALTRRARPAAAHPRAFAVLAVIVLPSKKTGREKSERGCGDDDCIYYDSGTEEQEQCVVMHQGKGGFGRDDIA
ncbi:MAG: hypothetical protein R6X25_05285 [Candidatus Krumholzibacteriia bacterium]